MVTSGSALRLVDSITELTGDDRGCVAVSGSHGGVSAARYAVAVRPLLTVFNDAGIGRDRAGVAGLGVLSAAGLAACAVSHDSACIGQAESTWAHGVVSEANPQARALGVEPGMAVATAVARLCGR